MKKIFSIILAVMMLIVSARLVEAGTSGAIAYSRDPGARISIQVFTTAQGQSLSSTITSDNRILGFTFSDSSAGWCALYDSATANGASSTNAFGEAYVAAGGVETIMFPMPKDLTNGLVVGTNNSTGTVMVYYE